MQSFSEIDTTSKRASKAAGFAWGIAEEVGKNMRNLEMFGLPGVKNLNLYLKKIKKKPSEKPKKIEKRNKPYYVLLKICTWSFRAPHIIKYCRGSPK
mgnify:CR=1 FL=1